MSTQLKWISDANLTRHVTTVIDKGLAGIAKAQKNVARNSIDPFSALFDASLQGISLKQWLVSEQRRQAQKTLQNALGHFHQQVLSSVNGCHIPAENFIDFVCDDRKIVAEIKNKYNTVKGSSLKDVYEELNQAVNGKTSKYKGYTAYYVTIIAANPVRSQRLFTPSDNSSGTKKAEQHRIIEIDGVSFYDIITGEKNALNQLYRTLPHIIQTVLAAKQQDVQVAQYLQDPRFVDFFAQTFAE
ncbi:MAG: Eco47II family restriction endonuclease [Sulfuriferula sp.]